ncbi:MAG TPA: hypothetical protein VFC26_10290 [Verrucomicrobiae bacterium]|nr:hypothetical protein [Verrucomicrobiae bacterium]
MVGLAQFRNDNPLKETSFSNGGSAVKKIIMPPVAAQARLSLQLTDETNIPALSEKNKVTINSSTARQNSPAVTPPVSKDTPIAGRIATRP